MERRMQIPEEIRELMSCPIARNFFDESKVGVI